MQENNNKTTDDFKSFFRNIIGSFGVRVLSAFLAIGSSIVLARAMGATQFGLYAYVLALIGLLSIPVTHGMPELITRKISVFNLDSNWRLMRGLIIWTVKWGAIICVLTVVIAWLISVSFGAEIRRELKSVFWLALLIVPLQTLNSTRTAIQRGLNYVVQSLVPELILLPILFILLVTCVSFVTHDQGLNALEVIGLRVIAVSVALVVGLLWLKGQMPREIYGLSPLFQNVEWREAAMPFLLIGGVSVINNQADIVMVGLIMDAKSVGVYKIVSVGAGLIVFALIAVNGVIGPLIARSYAAGDKLQLQSIVSKGAQLVLLGTLPIALTLIFFSSSIIEFMYGEEYRDGATALSILSVGLLVNAALGSVALILNMTGHESYVLKGQAFAAIINISLNFLLIPLWGLEGAATATAVSMIIWNVLLVCVVYKKLKISPLAWPIALK